MKDRLRVALDTNPLFVTQAGTARYVKGLLRGFRELARPDLTVQELAWPVENLSYRQPGRALRTAYRELVWANVVAPWRLRAWRPDVLHQTHGVDLHPPRGTRRVTTLYDLALLRHPERFRRWHAAAGARRLARLRHQDAILCISRFTADEALALLPVRAAQLEVIPCGCDFDDASPESPPVGDVPSEFLLFVGSLEPGKNLDLLVQAYQLAADAGAPLPPLVVVGGRWQGVGRERRPPASWTYLGHQTDAALVHLYRRAIALVFPSRYEGFGLPVVEAMALGCPVICSRVASLPEVGGDAAWYADPTPAAYADAMRTLAGNAALRAERIVAGRAQAARFTWAAAAGATAEVYRRLAG